MTLDRVNYLNIVLMLVAVLLAYILPFELFLFSYAVLGPLHYLTEIGWLHQRKYFTSSTNDYKWMIGLGVAVLLFFIADKLVLWGMVPSTTIQGQTLSAWLRGWMANIIIIAFVGGLAMVLFTETWKKLTFTLFVSGLMLLLGSFRPVVVALAILLPTLIHTTIFMVAFILYGSMRGKSRSGYLSVAVFVACCLIFFIYDPGTENYKIHGLALDSYQSGDFSAMNQLLLAWGGQVNSGIKEVLYSPLGIKIQRFVAFSYTYHYLNWFSKTHVIHWHEVSKKWLLLSAVLWALSVALYFFDFTVGLAALFMLSLLHVFLEFPLNYRSIIGIGQMMRGR